MCRRVYIYKILAVIVLNLISSVGFGDAIHSATGSGNIEEVRWLLKEDPKRVNARQQDGSTPIMSAAIRGFPDLAKLLIDSGADVNMGQYDGWMPLHAAVHDGNDEGHCEVARILIAHGAKIEARRTDGQWTPL